jgi:hypothetical protein
LIKREHESGRPPPKRSSKDGIPVDVMTVGEPGTSLVPGSAAPCFVVTLRLNEDMTGTREQDVLNLDFENILLSPSESMTGAFGAGHVRSFARRFGTRALNVFTSSQSFDLSLNVIT